MNESRELDDPACPPPADDAQHEERETLARFDAVLTSNPIALVLLDREFKVRFWNPAAEQLFGWSAEEVVGHHTPFVPDDLREQNADLRRRAREKAEGVTDYETRRLRKDGSSVPVAAYSTPILDERGEMSGVVLGYVDLTERKRLEAELLQAQKMETIGRLAGGVAHDFNNILTAIIGYTDIAQSMATDPELQTVLATVKSAAERAASLTQQLLAFSRRQMLRPQVLDAGEVVLAMEPMLGRLIGDDIELVVAATPGLGRVLVDRTQLEQVVLNLAVNARDAMPHGGRLTLEAVAADLTPADAHGEVPPGPYVTISVTDTGVGMDAATKARIFEPFFTTKELGKGTGLGLSTTYGIVRQSGGHITVDSELGHGTAFRLYLPRLATEETRPTAPPPPASGGRTGTVLLVEDEPTLRALARTVLTRRGFAVLAANHPAEAIELATNAPRIDLLVSDVAMPGMTGVELARQLRNDRPDLPVLLMSGYSEEIAREGGTMVRRFLAKPFTPDELLRTVDEALAADG